MTDFKIGDKVKIFRKSIPIDWQNTWVSDMNKYVGKEGIVGEPLRREGVKVTFYNPDGSTDDYFHFPIESLEKIYSFEEKTIEDI